MKSLIITAAGLSSRFSQSLGREGLKSIYFDEDLGEHATILNRMLAMSNDFESVVIVGGYRFEELTDYVQRNYSQDMRDKIQLVYNAHYHDKGSCYSLCVGVDALPDDASSVIFAEGDLCVDWESYSKIFESNRDVITITGQAVEASRSVALYFDAEGRPRYVYDTQHGCLCINEPFVAIYDSGQIWRFCNVGRLKAVRAELTEAQCASTNLELIGSYFSNMHKHDIDVIEFGEWTNCNTVDDYRKVFRERTDS